MSRLAPDPPKCLALLPCQSAVRDESTKQWTIHGTFDQMDIGDKFPVMVPEINVFVALGRGGSDKDTVHLAVLTPAGEVLGFCIVPIIWISNTAECYVTPRNIIFRTPGMYKLRLFVEARVGGTGDQHQSGWEIARNVLGKYVQPVVQVFIQDPN